MDARQAIQQAMTVHVAANPQDGESDESLGELLVAEYIVFLFALDTYIRYVEEATGTEDPEDDVISKGLRLLRVADSELDGIRGFLDEQLPTPSHKKMLARALRIRVATSKGVGDRALKIRTILSLGSTATMKAVFDTMRARLAVQKAMNAAVLDDADAALDLFAALPMKNARLRAWIDLAAKTAGSAELPQNAVQAAATEAADSAPAMLAQAVQEVSTTRPTESRDAADAKDDKLFQVQTDATVAAKRALARSGEPDVPLTRSEVVGVATAVAAAAATDPSNPRNIPDSLLSLDDEQRTAALTDGRVLVAAGAGSGKSTTLVSRVSYLVKERRVMPSRIFATSFNKKAADELKIRIAKSAGAAALQQMSVGTMHSLFSRFIIDYGTPAEKGAMSRGFVEGGTSVARTVQKLWAECFDERDRPVPPLKDVSRLKTQWGGNDVSPAAAKAQARTQKEADAADWYEMYEGLKGAIPGWTPPCEEKQRAVKNAEYQEKMKAWRGRGSKGAPPTKQGTTFEVFIARNRDGLERLGDFDDMLSIFRDILVREPGVRKQIQKMFDHVMVDECQDLNQVQTDIVMMMSEHISDGKDGKSLWMVGDDKQSIYGFRGAKPELFIGLDGKDGWKTRMIRTNYRCEPEIVEAANKLIAHNDGQIPMAANPAPSRPRGVGSVKVHVPDGEAEAALTVAEEIKQRLQIPGEDVANNAVLCRTNKELHAYETACIIRGIPYARKGVSSFLGSPETTTILGYVQLATGDDFEKMQKALGLIINKPNRFFLAPDAATRAVEDALSEFSRKRGMSIKTVNPVMALRTPEFRDSLAEKIAKTRFGFKFDKTVEALAELADSISEMQANVDTPGFKTTDLFASILSQSGRATAVDPISGRTVYIEQTLRESLAVDQRDKAGGDEEEEEEDEEDADKKGLGNIAFLFQLAQIDPTDPMDLEHDPGTPMGFRAKMERFAKRARDLRVDITKWDKEQITLPPEKRSPPPGVYLGTVHSTKGAQWPNTYVQMPKGKFPMEVKVKPGEEPPPPEETKAREEGERRLAYVALTRAAKTLTVLCPKEVGGRPAGVSRFVDEAGLAIGENVPKAATAEAVQAEVESLTDGDVPVKTADVDYDYYAGPDEDGWMQEPTPWNPEES